MNKKEKNAKKENLLKTLQQRVGRKNLLKEKGFNTKQHVRKSIKSLRQILEETFVLGPAQA